MDGLLLYGRMIGLSIRGQLEYRASFLMMTVGHLLVTVTEFLGMGMLFARFGSLQGWTLREAAVFYEMINVAWAFTEAMARGFDVMGNLIGQGTFDRILVRPRSTVLQMLGQDFQLMRIGRFVQGLVVLWWGSDSIAWTWPKLGLLLWAMGGAVALFTGLLILQATLCFWTVQSLEVFNAFTYGGVYTAQYPMSIYHQWFRRLLIYGIPLACVSYFPLVNLMGKPDIMGFPVWFGWISPLAGVGFLGVAVLIWHWGVRHYRGAGS